MAQDRSDRGAGEASPASDGPAADATAPADLPLPPIAPSPLPLSLQFLSQMRDRLAFGERALADHDIVRTRLPGVGDVYLLGHPEHLKRVLVTERETFRKSDDFRIAFGDGLLTVEGEDWRRQREALQPLFTRERVRSYAGGMVEQIRRRSRRWADGDRLDLQREFTDLTLDVLFATLLGRELALDGDERLRTAAERLHDWFRPTSYPLPTWVPTPARRRFANAKATIRQEADRLLAEAAADPPADPTAADDLLSLLVGLRAAGLDDTGMLSDERLRDQVVTLIFAGHDTTTTTLTFASWALATHPTVRERFHAEVDALDGPPTAADLDALSVTDRIVTETLRLYPPVYLLPRDTTTAVAVDGYRIPPETRINLEIRQLHRDQRFFEDPDTFRPARWAGDLRRELPDFAYAPFGGGPRICIGREFALVEAKLALATIGREYAFEWLGDTGTDEPPVAPQMTLRMEEGQTFRVSTR